MSHLDADGKARMVDVGGKEISRRTATAEGFVIVGREIMDHLRATGFSGKKGSVTDIARIAGIMGAKKTSELIPLCHPIGLDKCDVTVEVHDDSTFRIECTTSVEAKTGIEMEALTGVNVAALTLYDMCKAMSHDIKITNVQLIEKTGGKRDFKREKA